MDRHTFYNGEVQPSHASNFFLSVNPATAKPIARIFSSSADAIDGAISSAQQAFTSWSATPPPERARILRLAAQILRDRNDILARLETSDTGKPFNETSLVDIATGADVLDYYASLIASGGLNGEYFALRPGSGGATIFTSKEPLGVCAAIGAWNYPLQIALWKSAPCLAAGNTLVYKPSEYTPLHAEALAKIYIEAGLPRGVFNVVYGNGDVGAALVEHPTIEKVSFTGQVSRGRHVAGAAAGQMKYVTMELGGKSPLIVLPDADMMQAADAAMMANFFSSGQVCTNGTRVFVPKTLLSEFENILLEKIQFVRAGNLFDATTNFGPLSSRAHLEKVMSYIRHGINIDCARVLSGGTTALPPGVPQNMKDGFWIVPTIFSDCTDDMRIVREEIFGPIMCILPYEGSFMEAVRRANSTNFGLAAGVFGRDLNTCHQVAAALQAGIIWINTWGESPAEMAVGGWKQSGLGVENGRRGIEAWLRNKSTLLEMSGVVPTVFSKL